MRYVKKLLLVLLIGLPGGALAQSAVMHKTPWCGCCDYYAKYLEAHGYQMTIVNHEDMKPIRAGMGVPERLASCHTTRIGAYTVEGHMPIEVIDKLLTERPITRGIALPAMPIGSPGMPGEKAEPFTVFYLTQSPEPRVFTVY
jgi:hypothetical protein